MVRAEDAAKAALAPGTAAPEASKLAPDWEHSFLEHIAEAVLVYRAVRDSSGRVVDWLYAEGNAAAATGLGLTRAELVGRRVGDLIGPEALLKISRGWITLLEDGAPLLEEYEHQGRHYSTRRFRMDAQTIGTVALDVTELKAAQAQLMQSDRLASIGLLAAGVAHEVNNPLAWLTASIEFVEDELGRAQADLPAGRLQEPLQALAEAREGAQRIKRVVSDLKTFAHVEEGRRSALDLERVVESTVNLALNELRHRARVVRDYRPAPRVMANEARISQVVLNLLINAGQAIPEGLVEQNEIRVSLSTGPGGEAVIEVRDTGAGIREEIRQKIFEPFFTTKSGAVATGLGLSISRNIVGALGGEIAVESTPGHGASFRVTLPPAPQVTEALPVATPAPLQPARRGRVAVIDDEPSILASIRRVLAPEHEVVLHSDARELLDRVSRGERFDVLLCDLMMPLMTGMDLHQRLLAIAPDQAERMVLISGGGFTPAARAFLDRVKNPRLEKPFVPGHLQALVRGLVRR